MKHYLFAAIYIVLSFQTSAQNEMETECMKRIKDFSADFRFPKFTGQTLISDDTLKFDNKIIIISNTDSQLIKIFALGLVFPDLIYGASTRDDKYQLGMMVSADTSIISHVTELNFPDQRPDTKWFSFFLHQKMMNPSLYLFELTNKNIHSEVMIRTFIKKAKVTAFGFCSKII